MLSVHVREPAPAKDREVRRASATLQRKAARSPCTSAGGSQITGSVTRQSAWRRAGQSHRSRSRRRRSGRPGRSPLPAGQGSGSTSCRSRGPVATPRRRSAGGHAGRCAAPAVDRSIARRVVGDSASTRPRLGHRREWGSSAPDGVVRVAEEVAQRLRQRAPSAH